MRYSDEELDKADEYLGMSPDEQIEQCGTAQVHDLKKVKEPNNGTVKNW